MSITIRTGPYEIYSGDAFLDKDDSAVNYETGMDIPLNEIAKYIDMTEGCCGSFMAQSWRKALSGSGTLSLVDAEDYLKGRRQIECSKNDSPLMAAPGIWANECTLQIGQAAMPVVISTVESYPKILSASPDKFILRFGGKIAERGADWSYHTGNCHAYALHEHLGLSPRMAFDDIQAPAFYTEEIPGDDTHVYLRSNADRNGFEAALKAFYRPVGLIKSEDIPMSPILCSSFLEFFSEREVPNIQRYITSMNDIFQKKLKAMLDSGAMTEEKLKQRKYVLVMGYKMLAETPGQSSEVLWSQHSGILVRNGNNFELEAKFSFSEPVYQTSIALQSFIFSASSVKSGYLDKMMYRIYEPDFGDNHPQFNFDEELKAEKTVEHPILFRRIKMNKKEAEKLLRKIIPTL